MLTSYFAKAKSLPGHLEPVGIARSAPRWFAGRSYKAIAPTRPMLKMSHDQYIPLFDEILTNLDPEQVYQDLGPNAVLLCWEKPGEFCHRRRVAEWLEDALGIVIPEFGFERDDTPAYLDLQRV